jgi:predicted flap endonuclease-1-like 5' DNA nuclease
VDKDTLAQRGRSLEEDYFRKKDRELVEKMRAAAVTAAAADARDELRQATGIADPALLQELQDLGFTPDTMALLPLVPAVQTAWAEGGVTEAERHLLVRIARTRGIADGSPADVQLTDWMTRRPDEAVFTRANRLIRALLDTGSLGDLSAHDVVQQAEQIAAASGGILGIGKVSGEEKALLAQLNADLSARRS